MDKISFMYNWRSNKSNDKNGLSKVKLTITFCSLNQSKVKEG